MLPFQPHAPLAARSRILGRPRPRLPTLCPFPRCDSCSSRNRSLSLASPPRLPAASTPTATAPAFVITGALATVAQRCFLGWDASAPRALRLTHHAPQEDEGFQHRVRYLLSACRARRGACRSGNPASAHCGSPRRIPVTGCGRAARLRRDDIHITPNFHTAPRGQTRRRGRARAVRYAIAEASTKQPRFICHPPPTPCTPVFADLIRVPVTPPTPPPYAPPLQRDRALEPTSARRPSSLSLTRTPAPASTLHNGAASRRTRASSAHTQPLRICRARTGTDSPLPHRSTTATRLHRAVQEERTPYDIIADASTISAAARTNPSSSYLPRALHHIPVLSAPAHLSANAPFLSAFHLAAFGRALELTSARSTSSSSPTRTQAPAPTPTPAPASTQACAASRRARASSAHPHPFVLGVHVPASLTPQHPSLHTSFDRNSTVRWSRLHAVHRARLGPRHQGARRVSTHPASLRISLTASVPFLSPLRTRYHVHLIPPHPPRR